MSTTDLYVLVALALLAGILLGAGAVKAWGVLIERRCEAHTGAMPSSGCGSTLNVTTTRRIEMSSDRGTLRA